MLRPLFYSLSKGVNLLDQCTGQVRKTERISDTLFLVKTLGNGVVGSAPRDALGMCVSLLLLYETYPVPAVRVLVHNVSEKREGAW